jgi:hypothetical protein
VPSFSHGLGLGFRVFYKNEYDKNDIKETNWIVWCCFFPRLNGISFCALYVGWGGENNWHQMLKYVVNGIGLDWILLKL